MNHWTKTQARLYYSITILSVSSWMWLRFYQYARLYCSNSNPYADLYFLKSKLMISELIHSKLIMNQTRIILFHFRHNTQTFTFQSNNQMTIVYISERMFCNATPTLSKNHRTRWMMQITNYFWDMNLEDKGKIVGYLIHEANHPN